MTHPPLKRGWKLHDPPPSYNMDVWFPLNNPIKPCSVLDKIRWYTATTSIKITEIIPFTEKTNVKNWTFLVSMDVMSLNTNIQQNEGILKLSVTSIWKFQQRQPIPTHYLPEMLRLILKENFFHWMESTKTAVLITLPIFSWHILKQQLYKQNCL